MMVCPSGSVLRFFLPFAPSLLAVGVLVLGVAPGQERGQGRALFASPKVTVATPGHAVSIDVPIRPRARQLFLVVTDGGDGFSCDWADWAEPRLVDVDGKEHRLTAMRWKSASTGWGAVRVGRNAGGQPLRIAGQPVAYGIGTHANSSIVYRLPKGHRFRRFRARGGLDEGGTSQQGGRTTSVKFFVYDRKPPAKLLHGLPENDVDHVALNYFTVAEGFEVTLWAKSPLLMNPTNMDIDAAGRIWVAEGLNYRGSRKRPAGDRIVVVQDTDGDGKADASHTFVQDKELVSPLGVAVIGNRVIVSQPPHLIVYTDVDGDLKFNPAVDKRENLLSGFHGKNHDHSLHSVTVHPNGRYLFNHGNMGSKVVDRGGREFWIGSPYALRDIAGRPSWDGHVYIGAASFTVDPDGKNMRVVGHNYRNSYEQTATSFGDIFQNDNDDPPACRTSWVMEYANFGYSSFDGKRRWNADRRPGQPTSVAEWRQEDPGTTPAGDVYGGGAPTGIAFYENGALGAQHRGLLLSCESAKNVVFGYYPKPKGAGFELVRFDFLTTNVEKEYAGADFKGGRGSTKTLFRPSDVAVGPDGAIYVADWFDARVGGHATRDAGATGSIYRVAPKGFRPKVAQLDLETIAGQVAALRSPAVNVRALGFYALRERGAKAVPAVRVLLGDDNPYVVARAVHLLGQLGPAGLTAVQGLLRHADPQIRIVAFRALRHARSDVLAHAQALVRDPSPAVRREVALALRDVPFAISRDLLVALAAGYDGRDRWYLEALGTAAHGHEAKLYAALRKEQPAPERWSPAFAGIVWRLHVPAAVADLKVRAGSALLTRAERAQAIDTLAFIQERSAAEAMLQIATAGPDDTRAQATWWVRNRSTNDWRSYALAQRLPSKPVKVAAVLKPVVKGAKLPPIARILKLKGDAKRGKTIFSARGTCFVCHAIAGKGGQIGPDLTDIAQKFNTAVILESLIDPSADISLGFEAASIKKKDGTELFGMIVGEDDPVLLKDAAGQQHAIDKKDIKSRENMKQSLMPGAAALGLGAQDLMDLVAYLQSTGKK